MTDPIRLAPVRSPHTDHVPPSSTLAGHAAHPNPVLELLDGIDPPRAPRTGRPARCESPTVALRRRSVDAAIGSLVRGEHAQFDQTVRNDTRSLGALARLSESELDRRIGAAFDRSHTGLVDRLGGNYFATMRSVGRAVDRVKSAFREMVRNEAKTAVEDVIRQIDTMSPSSVVAALRSAEPGTPEAELARSLGVRGDSGDVARVEAEIGEMVDSLRTFRGHLLGNTWEPSDFPETTRRVLCRLGMSEAPPGSIVEDAIEGVRPMNDAGHGVVVAADVAVSVYEIGHVVQHATAVTVAPAGIAIAGLLLGAAIHHAVDVNIEDRRELAQEIGL